MPSVYSTLDEDRQKMIDETSAFVTWGLRHPEAVRWIPRWPIDEGGFSPRLSFVFWSPLLGDSLQRPVTWLRQLFGR